MADRPLVIESGQVKELPTSTALQTSASVAGAASLNMPHGTAPTSPVDGDVWTTSAGIFVRVNGTTVGPLTASGGSGALTLISEVVTAASQTTVTFSSIAATYRDLIIRVRGRGNAAILNVSCNIRFNGDTGNNYDRIDDEFKNPISGQVAGELLAASSLTIGYLGAASAPASTADAIEAHVNDYRGTTFQKALTSQGTLKTANSTGNIFVITTSGWWRSTAAISSITMFLSGGGFADGTVVSLYGSL